MKRGRPIKSEIRQNMIEVVYFLKKAYGYEIFKVYSAVYPRATLRSMYYNLKKGVELEEFKIEKIASEKGDYSWGSEAEKKYYTLGRRAKPKPDIRVKKYLDKKKK
ncbi:hypothetical protein HQ529_01770 [Candidatus Woesearchaeota archaeon]|nr:hypothetical protein [Candidatus Woesearchaeota archaeon]